MVDQIGLSVLAVALILVGVAMLAMLATYFTEGRKSTRAYLQRVKRAGIECLSPRNVAPFIGLERFCDEVDEAIEYLERQRYIVDTETARNLSGSMSCQITPKGQEWIDV